MNAREIAYVALLQGMQEKAYLSESLQKWQKSIHPSPEDYRLAQEISFGAMRMQLALHHYATQLATHKKIKLKLKEKALLYTALYQEIYMDKIPPYAIAQESVTIAKKYCHPSFAKFLNAMLRKIPKSSLSLPQESDVKSISIRYSYPEFFVQKIIEEYGLDRCLPILEEGNRPPATTARYRGQETMVNSIIQDPFPVVKIDKLNDIASSKNFYIQNTTPVFLMGKLAQTMKKSPQTILDLCASPGGKALLAHDLYPKAKLSVNDITVQKLRTLKENFEKYDIDATFSLSPGETYTSDTLFDLIILDVPCSNSGVLHKRPEARWRLSRESLGALCKIQEALFHNACSLLAPEGTLWYLTCSILHEENRIPVSNGILTNETMLPREGIWDGGFGLSWKKN